MIKHRIDRMIICFGDFSFDNIHMPRLECQDIYRWVNYNRDAINPI